MATKPSFGELLFTIRRSMKLTQRDFARWLHVAQGSIRFWERGTWLPRKAIGRRVFEQLIASEAGQPYAAALAAALGEALPKPTASADGPGVREALEAALFTFAEDADGGVRTLRPAMVAFLRHLAALKLSPEHAAASLEKPKHAPSA